MAGVVAGLDLDREAPDLSLSQWLPETLMRRHQLCPINRDEDDAVVVAMAKPQDRAAQEALRFAHQGPLRIVPASPAQIERAIALLLSGQVGLQRAAQAVQDHQGAAQDRSVVQCVDELLHHAWRQEASDLHIEPQTDHWRVRLRIDGQLSPCLVVSHSVGGRLIARLKVMANLDISERRLPQDGRIHFQLSAEQHCDYRVASCPTLHGEKLVLRRLDSLSRLPALTELGLDPIQLPALQSALQSGGGLILVTGPTGAGKTVTLYSALAELDPLRLNIATVEDPIEIRMSGLNQVEHAAKSGLTFATALRALLRQDPDVIMVGEIRDQDTAAMAIRAAQTGHLILSSVHSEDACAAIARLRNLGIPAYNLVATLRLVVAQRLIRRLHHCRHTRPTDAAMLRQHGFTVTEIEQWSAHQTPLGEPLGCAQCHQGYRGRIGAFEVLPISGTLSELIMADASVTRLREQARRDGVADLRQAGRQHVLSGRSSLAELHGLGLPTLH